MHECARPINWKQQLLTSQSPRLYNLHAEIVELTNASTKIKFTETVSAFRFIFLHILVNRTWSLQSVAASGRRLDIIWYGISSMLLWILLVWSTLEFKDTGYYITLNGLVLLTVPFLAGSYHDKESWYLESVFLCKLVLYHFTLLFQGVDIRCIIQNINCLVALVLCKVIVLVSIFLSQYCFRY